MPTGWPFWAATSDERIEAAFDLARLEAGEHLVDLGCGDGRVLLRAAALRGARVTGIDIDPAMAEKARRLLADHGTEGTVIEGDLVGVLPTLEPDVVFAYLSPATLQRLRRPIAALPSGTRVVSTGWAVPGWEPAAVVDRCYLYRLPVAELDTPGDIGWESEGLVVSLPADAPSLVAVRCRHPGGPVVASAGEGLAPVVDVLAGADVAVPGEAVVVDLRFQPAPAGTVIDGTLEVERLSPFTVLARMGAGGSGMWGVDAAGIAEFRDRFRRSP